MDCVTATTWTKRDNGMRNRTDRDHKQRGLAALEMALILPLLAAIFFLLLEGAYAMRTYSLISEASREAARLVLREGTTADVDTLVHSLTAAQLPGATLNTSVTTNTTQGTVTVEVNYDYETLFGASALTALNNNQTYVLLARTTMPLP
jgi:Flp pilus assembly protein TadG